MIQGCSHDKPCMEERANLKTEQLQDLVPIRKFKESIIGEEDFEAPKDLVDTFYIQCTYTHTQTPHLQYRVSSQGKGEKGG